MSEFDLLHCFLLVLHFILLINIRNNTLKQTTKKHLLKMYLSRPFQHFLSILDGKTSYVVQAIKMQNEEDKKCNRFNSDHIRSTDPKFLWSRAVPTCVTCRPRSDSPCFHVV